MVSRSEESASGFFPAEIRCRRLGQDSRSSNWQLHGHGVPLYTNVTYPFKKAPPRVMDEPPKDYTNFKHRNPSVLNVVSSKYRAVGMDETYSFNSMASTLRFMYGSMAKK